MLHRRHVLGLPLALGALAAGFRASPAAAKTQITDDGLHTQPWFVQSFLILQDDLAEAAAAGKRLAVVWEQRGCVYCRDMHEVNFAVPEIEAFVRDNFAVVSLNLHGARAVTTFEGEAIEERRLARKLGVVYTPTIQFFADPKEGKAPGAQVARMNGYLKPPEFLAMFRYVHEKAYDAMDFPAYLKARS